MSEWVSVLVVFWALWALDGFRVLPRRIFTFVSGPWRRGATLTFSRSSRPGFWPESWRVISGDIPLSISPVGVCNRSAGAAGRPAENLSVIRAWRWEDVRIVGQAEGWIFINDERFCPNSGHLPAPALLELARSEPRARSKQIDALIQRSLRPAHLRRRGRVLVGRTATVAQLNMVSLLGLGGLTLYFVGDLAGRVPAHVSERVALLLPWWLAMLACLHVAAVVMAWRVLRRLRPVSGEKRRTNLLSALLLPPQALRLRSLLAEGFFPAQHSLALALAFAGPASRSKMAFNVVADLRWPIGEENATALAREIMTGFRVALESRLAAVLTAAALPLDGLLVPPKADMSESCSYCPRCRDQFVAGPDRCPHGVILIAICRPNSAKSD